MDASEYLDLHYIFLACVSDLAGSWKIIDLQLYQAISIFQQMSQSCKALNLLIRLYQDHCSGNWKLQIPILLSLLCMFEYLVSFFEDQELSISSNIDPFSQKKTIVGLHHDDN
jgi:hypothetical protein